MESNDVELFSTTDVAAKSKVVSILVRNRISYLERWEKIPFLKRRDYRGAKELCIIYVNGNQYDKAKKILDEFNDEYFKRRQEKRAGAAAKETAADERAAVKRTETEEPADPDIDEGIDSI